jgi:mRNA-degrading endonuclease RelE of RelBE toxin-antitoxin system
MSCKVELSENFKKEAKRLSKKYSSLKYELEILFNQLESNPIMGIDLGNNVYKIRLAISSKNKGKSGGARIISYYHLENAVILLSIYNKGEKDSISNQEIQNFIDEIL